MLKLLSLVICLVWISTPAIAEERFYVPEVESERTSKVFVLFSAEFGQESGQNRDTHHVGRLNARVASGSGTVFPAP